MLALALAIVAVPPLPPFPSELRPRDAGTAPANAVVFALGDPAPTLDQVGFAATIDGNPAALGTAAAVGCCIVRVPFAAPVAAGSTVSVTVTSPGGELVSTWTAGGIDTTPPTITGTTAIDHGAVDAGYQMILAVDATDDTQIGSVTALKDGVVVGATVDGFTLRAVIPDLDEVQACVDVIVTDVAGNESAPTSVCVDKVVDGGEGQIGVDPIPCCAAECEGPGDVPVNAPSTLAVVALAIVLAGRRLPYRWVNGSRAP